jgi:hypothetical protein
MDRKKFLKSILTAGVCVCGAPSILTGSTKGNMSKDGLGEDDSGAWIRDLEKRMIKCSESPAWIKAEKGEQWIKALMEHMDDALDDQTKKKLMQACGRSCCINAFGVAPKIKPTREEAERYVKLLEAGGYKVQREGGKITIIFNWGRTHQNPWGLIMSDGYCMCPLLEKQTVEVSPTFCQCSTGYVKELFERNTGWTTTVELLDSLKMGGKDCIFKVIMETAG